MIDSKLLILFWQFTIKILDELEIVSNQNLSIEMFFSKISSSFWLKKKNLDILEKKKLTNPILKKMKKK